jgi:hypothetical protein
MKRRERGEGMEGDLNGGGGEGEKEERGRGEAGREEIEGKELLEMEGK